MDSQHNYTVEEVLKIVNALPEKDKDALKSILLLEEDVFERLVKEDFVKYEATFKKLA